MAFLWIQRKAVFWGEKAHAQMPSLPLGSWEFLISVWQSRGIWRQRLPSTVSLRRDGNGLYSLHAALAIPPVQGPAGRDQLVRISPGQGAAGGSRAGLGVVHPPDGDPHPPDHRPQCTVWCFYTNPILIVFHTCFTLF